MSIGAEPRPPASRTYAPRGSGSRQAGGQEMNDDHDGMDSTEEVQFVRRQRKWETRTLAEASASGSPHSVSLSIVHIIRYDIVQGFTVRMAVVLLGELADLTPQAVRWFPHQETDCFLERAVVALGLTVGPWMVGRSQDVTHALGFQVLAKCLRDDCRPAVDDQSWRLDRWHRVQPHMLAGQGRHRPED